MALQALQDPVARQIQGFISHYLPFLSLCSCHTGLLPSQEPVHLLVALLGSLPPHVCMAYSLTSFCRGLLLPFSEALPDCLIPCFACTAWTLTALPPLTRCVSWGFVVYLPSASSLMIGLAQCYTPSS